MTLNGQDALVLIAAGVVPALTCLGVAIKMTWWLSGQFSAQRKLVHEMHDAANRRILRLEYWAVLQRNGFQPSADSINGNGSVHLAE